jgi:hypothetical protein
MTLHIKRHHQVRQIQMHHKNEHQIDCWNILDEYALVSAVKEMGVIFHRRTPDSVAINFVSEIEFDFSDDLYFYCSSEAKRKHTKS